MAHAFERGGIPPPPLLPPPPRFAKPFERTPLVPWEQFSTLTKLASEEKRVLEEEGGGGGIGKKVSGNAHAIYIHYVPFPYRRTYLSSCVYMACVYSLRPQPSALLALSHVYVHRMMGWDGPPFSIHCNGLLQPTLVAPVSSELQSVCAGQREIGDQKREGPKISCKDSSTSRSQIGSEGGFKRSLLQIQDTAELHKMERVFGNSLRVYREACWPNKRLVFARPGIIASISLSLPSKHP